MEERESEREREREGKFEPFEQNTETVEEGESIRDDLEETKESDASSLKHRN
jgi:hypothetical protein